MSLGTYTWPGILYAVDSGSPGRVSLDLEKMIEIKSIEIVSPSSFSAF
jgi:hypothetical protein